MIDLPAALQARIFGEMEAAFPNEGGGFLLGQPTPQGVQLVDALHVPNVYATEEQYHRYAMTPQHWAQMEDAADARGLTLVGYYHSHPNSPAIPSEFDRVHALPNFIYIITSVMHGQAAAMHVWRLRPDRTAFDPAEWRVTGAD